MKQRMAPVVAMAAAGALTLAACSGGSSDDGQDMTIELWTAWTEGATTQVEGSAQIEQFEADTGYTVNQTNFTYDQLREKLIASAAGDNLPDAIWGLPEYVGEFNKLGILADLSDAWDSWEDKDLVSDSVKDAMTIDGAIIGFPYETTARAYLVHDSLLADASVEVPTTWQDVLEIGSSVEDATGSSAFGVAGAGVRAPQELLVYLAQYDLAIAQEQDGGGFRNTWQDNPDELAKATAVFEFYAALMSSGAANANSPTYGWEETDENFATALTATYVTGNWMAERESTNPDTMEDVSIHPIPYPADGQPATYIEAKPLMVMAGSDQLQGATELAMAFASQEWQQAAFADRSALSSVSTDSKWSQDFKVLLDTGITYPPVTLGTITQSMIDSLAMVLQEGQSAEETAIWLSDEINAALEDSGELAG
ncbi:MAG: ABC transporter substrate-binding protein [Beutenbergiaceae bacterium]